MLFASHFRETAYLLYHIFFSLSRTFFHYVILFFIAVLRFIQNILFGVFQQLFYYITFLRSCQVLPETFFNFFLLLKPL